MPIFSSPDQFEEHKPYIPLLKKALQTVKPDTQKKFVYIKQYEFGAKKLPLVLVDFDAGCLSALVKAGHKTTAEGIVTLTPKDELNFEAKKGVLKRNQIKKYFATLGGGIKAVHVPADEVDEESEAQHVEGEQVPSAPPEPTKEDHEQKRAEIVAQIKELASKSFDPKIEALKIHVLEKAKSLADANHFGDAKVLLDQLATKAGVPGGRVPTTAPTPPKAPVTNGDFQKQWTAAKQSWQNASDTVDQQIYQLQAALKKTGDKELEEIAGFGLNGIAGNFKVSLLTAIRQIDDSDEEGRKKAAAKARLIVAGFRKHIESDEAVQACDENPFKTVVSIRQTLGGALAALDKVLAAA